MSIRFSEVSRNALLSAIGARTDSGSAAGKLYVYTGSQPASPDVAATGTLLVTFTLPDPAFAAPVNSAMSLVTTTPIVGTAVAAGIAGWARLTNSDNIPVLDGSVGTANADFIINTTSLGVGHQVVLNTTISMT